MSLSLSQIIMELEEIASDHEHKLAAPEELAQRIEVSAEQLFRLAGRIRHRK